MLFNRLQLFLSSMSILFCNINKFDQVAAFDQVMEQQPVMKW